MARNFGNNAANYLLRSASAISNTNPTPVTLSCWIRRYSRATRLSIFNNNDGSDPGLYWELFNSGTLDEIRLYTGGDYVVSSTFYTPTNVWFHVMTTVDGSGNMTFFYNGVPAGTGSRSVSAGTTNTGGRVANLRGEAGFQADGELEDLAIWNRVLSATAAQRLYRGEDPRSVGGATVVWYAMRGDGSEPDRMGGLTATLAGTVNQRTDGSRTVPRPRPLDVPAAAGGGGGSTRGPYYFRHVAGLGA